MSDRSTGDTLQEPFLHESRGGPQNDYRQPDIPRYGNSQFASATSPKDLGEDPFSTFIKRVFAQLSLLVMFANTLSSVFSISAAVSLIPDDNAAPRYHFCEYGDNNQADGVFVQCPYVPSPVFQTFISLWVVYFVVYFSYKFWVTSAYETNDLRFLIFCDKFNSTTFNRVLVGLGVLLTFVSGIGAGQAVVHNGTTDSISPILVFMIVNWYNLYHMAVCKFQVLHDMDMHKEEAFAQAIVITTEPVWSVLNLNGLLVQQSTVFQYISDALNASLLNNNNQHIAAIGNVAQIHMAMRVLNPLQLLK